MTTHVLRYNRQFALLRFAGGALDADDVAAPDLGRVRVERLLAGVRAHVGHHLQLDALAAHIVEDELGARLANRVHSTGDAAQIEEDR